MPRDRILYSGDEPKMDIVARVGAESGSSEVIFIDDQIEHLTRDAGAWGSRGTRAAGPRITVFLATWGYVQSDWLREPLRVPTLTPQEFLSLIQREFS